MILYGAFSHLEAWKIRIKQHESEKIPQFQFLDELQEQ